MKTLAWGHFCKHDFPFLHIAWKNHRFLEKSRPFGPWLRSNISQVPPSQVNRGNLEMLLLRRGRCAGFRLRRPCLLEKLLQVFFPLLFSSRLFFFFPSLSFTDFLRSFYGAPPPPDFPPPSRLFFLLFPDLLDIGAPQEGEIKLPMCSSSAKYHRSPSL